MVARLLTSFFMSSSDDEFPRHNQARKDKQALGLRPSFASLHQCLLVWKGEAKTGPCRKQARKDKQAIGLSPLSLIACLSLYGIHGIFKFH